MKKKRYFICRRIEGALTWLLTSAIVSSQFPILMGVFFLIGLCSPNTAQAARLGTSSVSAGSAPPPSSTTVDSFQPDVFTGRATTSIPIAVSPGRKGMQPSVAMAYSSSGRNGWVGVGWNLDLGYIERATRKGVPKYDATDTYSFLINGVNSDLVQLSDGTYRAKDEGAFLKVEFSAPTGWLLRDKSGTRYLFGQTDASRVSSNGVNVFRWHLDKVIDVNGNSMSFGYVKLDGMVYPATIDYTAHETLGTSPMCRVNFILEDRPDIETSFRSGYLLSTRKRLAAIESLAKVNNALSLTRRYNFSYHLSKRTGRSLLVGAQQFGADGLTSLPPVSFGYQENTAVSYTVTTHQANTSQVAWNVRGASYDCGHNNYGCVHPYGGGPCGPANYGSPVIVKGGTGQDIFGVHVDVGTDGNLRVTGNLHDRQIHAWTAVFLNSARTVSLPLVGGWDVCCLWIEDSGGVRGPVSPGNVSFSTGWSLIHMVAYNQNDDRTDGFGTSGNILGQVDVMSPSVLTEPQLAGDVDGNGITDIIDFKTASGMWSVYSAQLPSVILNTNWLTGFGSTTTLPLLGDWNGDGRTDIGTFENGTWRFALSTGANFEPDALPSVNFGTGAPFTGDFNGDGNMDIGVFTNGNWTVQLGTGAGFLTAGSFNFTMGDSVLSNQHLTGDFNGDGLTDIAFLNGNQFQIALSDGNTFRIQPALTVSGFGTNFLQSADLNGDGLSDLSFYDTTMGKVMVAYNTNGGFAPFADLSPSLTFTPGTAQDQIQIADFNGDSLPDPAIFNATTGRSQFAFSQGGSPDLLISIDNGVGGGTLISYQPASSIGQNFLPFLTPVVTQTVATDGLGGRYTNSYTYTGGLYDGTSKEFRGFARVDIKDPERNVATTYFNQDDIFKGRPKFSEFHASDGRLFSVSTNSYDAVALYPGTSSKFVRLVQSDNYNYDGTTDFKHTRTRIAYDDWGNVTAGYSDGDVNTLTDDRSTRTTYTLNTNAWILNRPSLVVQADASGTLVTYRRFFYDDSPDSSIAPTKGNLTREEEWLDVDRSGPVGRWIPTRMTYDGYGNVKIITDALNHSVTNTYDASGTFLVQVANPLGHTRTMVYDPRFGYIFSSTDQNGVTTSSEYDALGRVIKVIGPLDTPALPTTRYEYDLSTNPAHVTQYTRVQSGQVKELVSHTFTDGLGRTIQVRSPAQNPSKQVVTGTVEFDFKGRVVRQWTPYLDDNSNSYRDHNLPAIAPLLAAPVVHSYDPLGRLAATTDPDGSQTSIAYDHWTVTTTDAKQHVKRRISDASGRLIQVQEFDGLGTNATHYATTAYQYDSRDNLVLLTDAVGNTTTLQYDSLNRKISMTDPDMGNWTYAYDDVNKLVAQTDARGVSILFTYDALNRQTRKDYAVPPNIDVPTLQPPVIYTYDSPAKQFSKGRLTEITDGSGSSGFAYDTLGRLVVEQKTVDGTAYTIQRAYDLLGRLITLTYPNNDVAAYTYNDQGGIQTISLQTPARPVQPIINSVDYNAAGQITKMVYGNGVSTDYTYNPQTLRLDNLKSVGPGGVLQDFTYSFDAVGNVSAIVDAVHTASQTFTYDSLNRLATANGARYGNFIYAYNQIGNMTSKEGVTQNYGAVNNKPHAVSDTSSGLTLNYDANGNLASKSSPIRPTQTFVFDAENRLVEVGSPTPFRKLDPGWNFVSFPQIVGEVPVTSAFTTFAGNCEQLTRFNTRSNKFESFANISGTNQFESVNGTNGYAVYVTNAAGIYLPLGDTPAPSVTRQLQAGTNFLAGPPEIMSATNWLVGLVFGVDYDQVLGLGPSGTNTVPVTTVRPGEAYYVGMLRHTNWTPPTAAHIANPSTVRFVYDGDGGRVKKITWKGTTLFLGQSYEVSTEGRTTTYILAGGMRIAAKESNGSFRVYHSDHLGSANVITDQTGSTAELIENSPYGFTTKNEGIIDVAHKFTGQRFDDETDLYYYGARYYDPELGRFISPDSLVQAPFNPQNLNRYSYCVNSPIQNVDPSGHFWFVPLIIGAIIGAAAGAIESYNLTGHVTFKAVALGALQGALAGATLGSSAAELGFGYQLAQTAAVVSLGSQVSGAVGNYSLQSQLQQISTGLNIAYGVAQVGEGISTWSSESNFKLVNPNTGGAVDALQNNDHIFVNGVNTPEQIARSQAISGKFGANNVLAYNPSHGPIADVTEAALEKFVGPSSVSRQLADKMVGLSGITLTGYSQGGIISASTVEVLASRGQVGVVSKLNVINTQVSAALVNHAASIGGISKNNVFYGSGSMWDFSNFLAPNLNPQNLIGGALGTALLPFGISEHGHIPPLPNQ